MHPPDPIACIAFGLAFALLTLVFIGASLDDDGPGPEGGI
jgi:hypothetical protein